MNSRLNPIDSYHRNAVDFLNERYGKEVRLSYDDFNDQLVVHIDSNMDSEYVQKPTFSFLLGPSLYFNENDKFDREVPIEGRYVISNPSLRKLEPSIQTKLDRKQSVLLLREQMDSDRVYAAFAAHLLVNGFIINNTETEILFFSGQKSVDRRGLEGFINPISEYFRLG